MQPSVAPWPNLLSILRIALVPVALLAAEAAHRAGEAGEPIARWRLAVFGLLVLIGLTDLFDGWLARRFGWTSELGALLDAVADKLVQLAMIAYLALRVGPAFPAIPLWVLVLVVGRDVVLLAGYLVIRRVAGRVEVSHASHGKLSSTVLFAAIAWTLLGYGGPLGLALFAAAAVLILRSTAGYVRRGFVQARAQGA